MTLETIMIADGDDRYAVFLGNENTGWTEMYLEKDMNILKTYLKGLLAGAAKSTANFQNGPKEDGYWWYAGVPLPDTDFQEVIESLTHDGDTYC